MRKNSVDKRLLVGRQMPRLRKKPGAEYADTKDETLKWIATKPELLGYVFSRLVNLGYIDYDAESGTWSGVDAL